MRILIITVIIICLILVLLSLEFIFDSAEIPCDPPEKVEGVPKKASWGGGCDGGFWFELVKLNKNSANLRVRIYSENDGELVLDSDFKRATGCNLNIKKASFRLCNKVFSYSSLYIEQCEYVPIYPAYGGTYWMQLKEMGKF